MSQKSKRKRKSHSETVHSFFSHIFIATALRYRVNWILESLFLAPTRVPFTPVQGLILFVYRFPTYRHPL